MKLSGEEHKEVGVSQKEENGAVSTNEATEAQGLEGMTKPSLASCSADILLMIDLQARLCAS